MRVQAFLYSVGVSILLGTAEAADITNYSVPGCAGNGILYKNVPPESCCGGTTARVYSARFDQMTTTGIGSVFRTEIGVNEVCGRLLKSTASPDQTCVTGVIGRGSMWKDPANMLHQLQNPGQKLPPNRPPNSGEKVTPQAPGQSQMGTQNPFRRPQPGAGAGAMPGNGFNALRGGQTGGRLSGGAPGRLTTGGAIRRPGKSLGAFGASTRGRIPVGGGSRRPFKRDAMDEFKSLPEEEQNRMLEGCKRQVLPDILILADGHQFLLGNSTDHHEHGQELLSLLDKGRDLSIEDVPKHLHRYKV